MTNSSVLRGTRRENRAEIVNAVAAHAGPRAPAIVVVPRAAAARSLEEELLRRSPAKGGYVRFFSSRSVPGQRPELESASLVIVENLDELDASTKTFIDHVLAHRADHDLPTITSVSGVDPGGVTARCSMIRVHHPAIEADAAFSVVHRWIADGADPDRLVVAVPQHDGHHGVLLRELASAAKRLGIAATAATGRLGDHQIVAALAKHLAVADRDGSPHERAFAWWQERAGSLLADRESVDLVSSFIRALSNGRTVSEALGTTVPSQHRAGVSVVVLDDALDPPSDRPWQGAVLVGCIDGIFPRRRFRASPGTDTADRLDALLANDRRRLDLLGHAIQPNAQLVAIAAPSGGSMPSPFLDGWPREEFALLRVPSRTPPRPPAATTSTQPVFPTGRLRLSATQLTTFEDCSWRYAFEYGVGLRGAGGAPATAGTLVHGVLETFLDPQSPDRGDRSLNRLLAILESSWDHAQFPYSAQALDYRRRAEQWVSRWFDVFAAEDPDVRQTEHRFEVSFPPAPSVNPRSSDEATDLRTDSEQQHQLVGSIDRVDVLHSASGSGVRIVDYKSGSPKSQSDVDDDLQLAIYHYAALHDPVIHELGDPVSLELHYLQDDSSREKLKVLARRVTPTLVADTIARVEGLVEQILTEQFEPNTDANCDYCAFHALCPVQVRGRNVA